MVDGDQAQSEVVATVVDLDDDEGQGEVVATGVDCEPEANTGSISEEFDEADLPSCWTFALYQEHLKNKPWLICKEARLDCQV